MIKVLKPGLWSSIQDNGRMGHRSKGLPLSGVMDTHSSDLANKLVGNPLTAAVLECTAIGPELYFGAKTVIAVTGANFGVFVNGVEFSLNTPLTLDKGSTIKLKNPKNGWRGYIAIQGGFKTETVLGSQSMYAGITKKGKIDKNDILEINPVSKIINLKNKAIIPLNFEINTIEVYKGPEYEMLPDTIKLKLKNSTFLIHSNSNRMATQIDGLGEVKIEEIITAPVQPGTVQLTPSGTLLILAKDAQTTGGYPRVFQLTKKALNILAQKRPNEEIKFTIVKYLRT